MQWAYSNSPYNDFICGFPIAFNNKCFACFGTKNHDSAQYIAINQQTTTHLSIHSSQKGSTWIFIIGY